MNTDLIRAAIIRAAYTFGEVLLSFMAVGMTITEVPWSHALSVAFLAALISLIKTLLAGCPEAADDGSFYFDASNKEDPKWALNFKLGLDELSKRKSVRFKIDDRSIKEALNQSSKEETNG